MATKKDKEAQNQEAAEGADADAQGEAQGAVEEGAGYSQEVVEAANPAAAAMVAESGSTDRSTVRLQESLGRINGVAVGDTLYTDGAAVDTKTYSELCEKHPDYFVSAEDQEKDSEDSEES